MAIESDGNKLRLEVPGHSVYPDEEAAHPVGSAAL